MKGRLGNAALSKYEMDMSAPKKAKLCEAAALVKPSKYDKPLHKPEPPPVAAAKKGAVMKKKAPVK